MVQSRWFSVASIFWRNADFCEIVAEGTWDLFSCLTTVQENWETASLFVLDFFGCCYVATSISIVSIISRIPLQQKELLHRYVL